MAYINRNIYLAQLQEIIQQNLHQKLKNLPESFNDEQKYAFEVFQKRIFLDSIIEETISFNKKLSWSYNNKNLKLVKTAEELIEVFKLRSDVYSELNYQTEFADIIDGLNFDNYDKTSAIMYYKNDKEITATIRLIFDLNNYLPTEDKYSIEHIRKNYKIIGEISRNIVKYRGKGLNLEFKYLMCGIYNIFMNNDIDIAISTIKKEHLKLFEKLGGVNVLDELNSYGSFNNKFYVISYNPNLASEFFRKVFLEEKI